MILIGHGTVRFGHPLLASAVLAEATPAEVRGRARSGARRLGGERVRERPLRALGGDDHPSPDDRVLAQLGHRRSESRRSSSTETGSLAREVRSGTAARSPIPGRCARSRPPTSTPSRAGSATPSVRGRPPNARSTRKPLAWLSSAATHLAHAPRGEHPLLGRKVAIGQAVDALQRVAVEQRQRELGREHASPADSPRARAAIVHAHADPRQRERSALARATRAGRRPTLAAPWRPSALRRRRRGSARRRNRRARGARRGKVGERRRRREEVIDEREPRRAS